MQAWHVCISLFVEDDFWLDLHLLEFGIPYRPQCFRIVCVSYHHALFWSQAKFASALNIRDESAGLTSESAYVVERSLIWYLVTISIVCRFSKSMQYLVWCFVWCLIDIAVNFFQTFIRWSLMEIDCSINCFSLELNWSLGVNHHHPGLFSNCTDHAFGNTILKVSVWRAWLVCCAAAHKNISEGRIVVFSLSIVAPELPDLVSHWVYSGLIWLVGGCAGLGFLIWEQPYGCVSHLVVDE